MRHYMQPPQPLPVGDRRKSRQVLKPAEPVVQALARFHRVLTRVRHLDDALESYSADQRSALMPGLGPEIDRFTQRLIRVKINRLSGAAFTAVGDEVCLAAQWWGKKSDLPRLSFFLTGWYADEFDRVEGIVRRLHAKGRAACALASLNERATLAGVEVAVNLVTPCPDEPPVLTNDAPRAATSPESNLAQRELSRRASKKVLMDALDLTSREFVAKTGQDIIQHSRQSFQVDLGPLDLATRKRLIKAGLADAA